jgi:MSHA biogenesis protein MshM
MMIRSFYGLTQNPFDLRELVLLPHQQEIHDTLKVHCQQGGLCLVLGVPGSGKSVIKQSLQRLPEKQHLVATVARTLLSFTSLWSHFRGRIAEFLSDGRIVIAPRIWQRDYPAPR